MGAEPDLGLARVQADIQRTVDAGEIRLPKPRPGATRPPRAGRGSVEANTVKPLSKNPGAVHALSDFLANLESSGYFGSPVEIVDSRIDETDQGDVVQFELRAVLNPRGP